MAPETSTYFADKIRDVLYVDNLTSLTIVETGGFGLQAFHTVFHLNSENNERQAMVKHFQTNHT